MTLQNPDAQTQQQEPILKGRARLYISDHDDLRPAGVEKPLVAQVFYDIMEAKAWLSAWQTFLLLPDGYEVIGAYFDVAYYRWCLIVEHPAIPFPAEGEMLPLITPTYQRTIQRTETEEVASVQIVALTLL